ncbi:hypothetical protein BDY21DRAFT_375430 [Lineolata rhizophorae]|uniref:Uncharacterized protein n=1 Tax=Lineolata rhizophorae TaxID=578093 RepID=A0A6A6NMQ4_9PEZI|nr:hypothetical protein BDY21DRAFT_375430 [Lineolata rhizophorae]
MAVHPAPLPAPPAISNSTIARQTTTAEPSKAPAANAPLPTAHPLGDLELREIVADPAAAATNQAQAPTVTTAWIETELADGTHTWVEIVFTQTFAPVLDQLPSPAAGSVGMGSLTGEVGVVKTAVPEEAGAARVRGGGGGGGWERGARWPRWRVGGGVVAAVLGAGVVAAL